MQQPLPKQPNYAQCRLFKKKPKIPIDVLCEQAWYEIETAIQNNPQGQMTLTQHGYTVFKR